MTITATPDQTTAPVSYDDLKDKIIPLLPEAHPARIILECTEEDETSRDGESRWVFGNITAPEILEAIEAHQPSPKAKAAAQALQKPIGEVTPEDIALTYEHFMIVSNIATLAENGQPSAAKFLIEHHDIDPDTALIKAALANLASPRARAAVEKYARAYQKSQIE